MLRLSHTPPTRRRNDSTLSTRCNARHRCRRRAGVGQARQGQQGSSRQCGGCRGALSAAACATKPQARASPGPQFAVTCAGRCRPLGRLPAPHARPTRADHRAAATPPGLDSRPLRLRPTPTATPRLWMAPGCTHRCQLARDAPRRSAAAALHRAARSRRATTAVDAGAGASPLMQRQISSLRRRPGAALRGRRRPARAPRSSQRKVSSLPSPLHSPRSLSHPHPPRPLLIPPAVLPTTAAGVSDGAQIKARGDSLTALQALSCAKPWVFSDSSSPTSRARARALPFPSCLQPLAVICCTTPTHARALHSLCLHAVSLPAVQS